MSADDRVFIDLVARQVESRDAFGTGGPAAYPLDVRTRLDADAVAIIARYPQPGSALLPLLHLVQSEDGYITAAGIDFCSHHLQMTGAEVASVATFYSMYRRSPTGDYLVGVCTNTLCAVMGGDAVMAALEEHLDTAHGGNSADGRITLQHIECNAACDYAPVVMVNWEFFDNQTPESARSLVDDLRSGAGATPSRGEPLCTFRETERILAGFPDPRPESAREGDAVGAPTVAGLSVARARGMRAPDQRRPASGLPDQRRPASGLPDQNRPASGLPENKEG